MSHAWYVGYCALLLGSIAVPAWSGAAAGLTFSTPLGGGAEDTIRDVAVDAAGTVYAVGGTASADHPALRHSAVDGTFNGRHDVSVVALDPDGRVRWGTYLGGAEYDRAYAVEVGPDGSLYVGGRAGPGFPTTPGAVQPDFRGYDTGAAYGRQNAFLCRLAPDGARVDWCTYVGTLSNIRDLAVDDQGDVYVAGQYVAGKSGAMPAAWFAQAWQSGPQGGNDGLVLKIAADGTAVRWASYLGGGGNDGETPSVRVGTDRAPVVLMRTTSSGLPRSTGQGYRGQSDLYVAQLSPDGTALRFGAYLGGSGSESSETHGVAWLGADRLVVGATTTSRDLPVTPGVCQAGYGGSGGRGTGAGTNYPGDGFVAVLQLTPPALLALSYLGGSRGEGIEGVAVRDDGTVCVSGATYSANFRVTPDAWQGAKGGAADAFVACLAADLRGLGFASYLGASKPEYGRGLAFTPAGHVALGGMTQSADWPAVQAWQPAHGGGWDAFIAVGGVP